MQDPFLVIKGICNTNCTFCNFYEIKSKVNEEEHLEELKVIIQELYLKGIKTIKIGVHGYEPTSFIYFFDILEFIKKKNIEIILSTNGVKLASNNYTKKLSKYVKKVYLTIYSSNDKEHNILTGNKDSYNIKHLAISNCINNEIFVEINILLLIPTIINLNTIIEQLSVFFSQKYFYKSIVLSFPHFSMGFDRNRLLIPSYSSTIKYINYTISQKYNILEKNDIILSLNSDIPECIYKNIINNIINKPNKNIINNIINKPNIGTYNSNNHKYLLKCNSCEYKNQCKGVDNEYLKIYGNKEFEEGLIIENLLGLDQINDSLSKLINKYKNNGVWLNYKYVNEGVKDFNKISIIPKKIFNYYLEDISIKNNTINKIKFINEKKENLIINLDINSNSIYSFFVNENKGVNSNMINFVIIILNKIFNKGIIKE